MCVFQFFKFFVRKINNLFLFFIYLCMFNVVHVCEVHVLHLIYKKPSKNYLHLHVQPTRDFQNTASNILRSPFTKVQHPLSYIGRLSKISHWNLLSCLF